MGGHHIVRRGWTTVRSTEGWRTDGRPLRRRMLRKGIHEGGGTVAFRTDQVGRVREVLLHDEPGDGQQGGRLIGRLCGRHLQQIIMVIKRAQHAADKAEKSNIKLSEELKEGGYRQNAIKQEVLPAFVGDRAHCEKKLLLKGTVTMEGKLKDSARYLGVLYQWDQQPGGGTTTNTISLRLLRAVGLRLLGGCTMAIQENGLHRVGGEHLASGAGGDGLEWRSTR